MDGLCRNTEAGKLAFHVPPNSVRLPEERRAIAHSAGIPPENWRKVHTIAIIMELDANLLPLRSKLKGKGVACGQMLRPCRRGIGEREKQSNQEGRQQTK